jgi:hypothetical protein
MDPKNWRVNSKKIEQNHKILLVRHNLSDLMVYSSQCTDKLTNLKAQQKKDRP